VSDLSIRRLAASVAATALVALAPAPVAAAPERPGGQTAETVTVRGVAQTNWVTREGTWELTLAVDGAPPGSTVTADPYSRVADRAEYDRTVLGVLGERDVNDPASIPEVALDDAPVRADGSREVKLAVALRQDSPSQPGRRFFSAGLRPGVYPVDVRVVGPDGADLSRLVTHITRVPSAGDPTPTSPEILVAPLVTLGAGPSVDDEGNPDPDPSVARAIEDLAEGLGMFPDLPLTLVPRPESVEALAREEGSGDALATLQDLARARQVVDGTYVEVPVSAWVDDGLTEELTRQRARGNSVLTEQLGRADSSTWDARPGLTPDAAAALWPVGVRSVILDPGAVEGGPVTGPVTILTDTGRSLEAVVPDADLSRTLARDPGDPVLDAAAFASQLALAAADPAGARGVVIDPPEGWLDDPTNVVLLGQLLLDPAAPVEPVTVAQLLDRVPSTGTRQLAPSLRVDLDGYADRLGLARARLSSYASLVGSAAPGISALDQLLLLSGSTSLSERQRSVYVERVLTRTEDSFQDVQAPEPLTVTLTSSDGDLPLTLLNDLDVPATVTVDVRASGRVEIRDGWSPTQTLQPGRNQLEIPVHARAPGDSKVAVTVRTTDGEVTIDEVDYTVRSTAVPGIGVVLSAGAVIFLLVWWARHWLRDRRARGGGDDGGGDPDAPEPGPDDTPGATVTAPPELVST
jgi:hypothetical protein